MPGLEYSTIRQECSGEFEEKKSRFIATLRPVSSEEEALGFISEMKKRYWDARHNCSAYIIIDEEKTGADAVIRHCSDDGEPSRTAGMPMLEVLDGKGLGNICCVVTRYFGGILLGTGGLVRAYQAATAEGIANADIVTKKMLNKAVITLDYNAYGKIDYLAGSLGVTVASTDFSDVVKVTVYAGDDSYGKFLSAITEATAGKAVIEELGSEMI